VLATHENNPPPSLYTKCARAGVRKLTAEMQGFRTYPSFLHFLAAVTLLAAYVATVCIRGLVFAFSNPFAIVRTRVARRKS